MLKNILIITNENYPSGMAGTQRIRRYAEVLTIKGAIVKVFILPKSNGLNSLIGVKNNVHYFTLGYISNNPIAYILNFLLNIIRVRKLLLTHRRKDLKNYLILYDGISIDNALFILLGNLFHFKIVVDIVEDYSLHEERVTKLKAVKFKLNQFLENHMISFVDGIMVLSSYLESKFIKKIKPGTKIINIPISAGNLEYKPRNQTNNNNLLKFVYCGTFGQKDGIDYLLKAFDIVSKKNPNVLLMLSGKSKENIDKIINEHNRTNIKYVGFISEDQYYEFLSNADVLCMTRIKSGYANAGFPFKLGEYLASGKPVITTNVSDINKFLEDKKDAIFAKPSNIESLCEALEYVINNQQECSFIGLNGRNKAFEFFNPDKNGELLLNFLEEIWNN